MRVQLVATLGAAIALGAMAPRAAMANLIVNGSFEQTTTTPKNYFTTVAPTGWSGGGNLTFLDAPGTADNGSYLSVYGPFPKTSPDGGNFVEADGAASYNSAFYQTIGNLQVGQEYVLSFWQAAGQQTGFTGPTTEQWQVTFGTTTKLSPLFTLQQGGVGAWQKVVMDFIASSTSQVITFLALGTPNGEPPICFIDGIDMEVPEPGAVSIFGIGLVALGALSRRRASVRKAT
jgi:hypothetical protein